MKAMRYLLLTLVAALGLISATSCISDDITTSPSVRLIFSRDTVSFDTVFTDLGTPTARLVVRNPEKKGVIISSIRFRRPDTEFTLNVDGVSGREFSDVEIRGRDSIYIFIECYINEDQESTPRLTADDLDFIVNGTTQSVRVEAYGQNVTRLRGLTLGADTRLTADRPYIVFDSLVVAPGVTLSIDPGASLLFHDGAYLRVRGRLEALGELGKKINMRGDRLDDVLPDVSYDIMAGQWGGVILSPESMGNVMEYVDMRSTEFGLVADSCADLSQPKLTIRNSWLHNSQWSVLTSRYARVDATGCCFSEAAGPVVSLEGGEHDFLQCTIANNYLFSSIQGPLLELLHAVPGKESPDAADQPPMSAQFINTIIYGLAGALNEGDLTGSDVYFRYVSLKSAGNDDEHFINCFWDTDPMFLTIREDYYFNYRLQEDSPVKDAGDPAFVTEAALYDMDGVDRLREGKPSLGAYQYRPE